MNTIIVAFAVMVSVQVPVASPSQLVEAVGEQGAAALAAERGLEPILLDHQKSVRQGFDQVYRSGNQVIVIEAKGGSSRLGVAYRHAQASEGWALEVARRTLQRSSATHAELAAARSVLQAARKGNLSIEVVRTKMRDGQLRTVVEQVITTRNDVAIARLAAALGVALEIYIRIERAIAVEVEYAAGKIDLAERDLRHLKNVGGSVGALGAAGTALVFVGPQGVALSLLVGGSSYLIGDYVGSQGAAMLADWLHDAGISVSQTCAAMADRASTAAVDAWSSVQRSGGSAWSWTAAQGGVVWGWASDTGGDAWTWTARRGDDAWDWTADTSTSAWNWTSESADGAWSWTRHSGQAAVESAQETGLDAWQRARRSGVAAWKWANRQLPSW